MKKIGIAILLILIAASIYFIKFKKDENSLAANATEFAVKDTASITKIFLADREHEPITLTKKNGEWYMNNEVKANTLFVKKLIKTMYGLSVKSAAPKGTIENVSKFLIGKGIKVEIYANDEKIKCYYVGNADQDHGTYMLLENSKQPYSIILEGFNGYLTPRFRVDYNEIRDKTIFKLDNKNIKNITVEYTNNPNENVYYYVENNKKFIKNKLGNNIAYDTLALNLWLQSFNNFYIEDYNNYLSPNQVDSVIKGKPAYAIFLETNTNQKYNLAIYPKKVPKGTTDKAGIEVEYDVDRTFVYINNKDLVFAQYGNLDSKAKKLNFFIPTVKK